MKTIKKTTLIAAVAAMAAFAVPSMASAATWAPLNANKTLTSTGTPGFVFNGSYLGLSISCSSSTLGVHVRTPASSTMDITSASWTGCVSISDCPGQPVTVTATGLPWAVTGASFTEHLQITWSCLAGYPHTGDGLQLGTYNNATHTLSAHPSSMKLFYMGSPIANFSDTPVTSWHETTNTLTLS